MLTRAVILDLDGLIVDSEPIHQKAFNVYLARHAIPYQFEDEEYGRVFVGVPVRANAEYLIRRFGLFCSTTELLAEREAIFESLINQQENLTPMPGLRHFLDDLQERGVLLAVASATPRGQVETILSGMAIASQFKVIVTGTDVARAKPAPDVYLRAVAEIGVEKKACVAIEDSSTGIAAAKAAGLRVIAIPNRYTCHQNLSLADERVGSLNELTGKLGFGDS